VKSARGVAELHAREIRGADLAKVNLGAAKLHAREIRGADLAKVNLGAAKVDS
jgi:uncharacterized protein YjbI with pentapeptide repeats